MSCFHLITPDDLKGKFPKCIDVPEQEILCAIESVTDEIECEIGYKLIVRNYEHKVCCGGWDCTCNCMYEIAAAARPVVQAIYPAGTSFGGDENAYIKADCPHSRVHYFAGYRRKDQTLSDLQQCVKGRYLIGDQCGTCGDYCECNTRSVDVELKTLPPQLPGFVREVALRLVYDYLLNCVTGTLGASLNVASQNFKKGADSFFLQDEALVERFDFRESQFKRLDKLRSMC